jgi:hypothetical protein
MVSSGSQRKIILYYICTYVDVLILRLNDHSDTILLGLKILNHININNEY